MIAAPLDSARRSGAVAQLGEHLVCNQGVEGSNPFRSILMDAATILQYRFLLVLLGAGFVAGVVAVALLRGTRAGAGKAAGAPEDATRFSPWRDVMALLVAVAVSSALIFLLPAGIVFRFFHSWQAVVYLVVFVVVAAAPVGYAIRIRAL